MKVAPRILLPAAVLLIVFLSASPAAAEADLAYYLPADVTYAPDVPRPADVLGWEVGEWHVRHDQLIAYLRTLAERSDRMRIEVIGKTYEERPLVHLTVSSPANLARLEEIFEAHRKLSEPTEEKPTEEKPDTSAMPVVVYLGYSIHGNEASGSNASLLVAYHLAAARGEAIDELLANAVIVIDPSLNPDGLARFASWANMHRGQVLVADPDHREHREGWPNGRTNHYWFDLNRDWLLAQHPESRARLEQFHRRRPNVLTDFHEMGTDSTFFFQPGVPSRQNPLTPDRNLELTHELARFHADALDRVGSLYYTEEQFDDFYYGKGSTYPDLHGAVGILFEQASVRGHLQDSDHGPLSFPFAIRNQFLTSLSSLEGALAKRRELLDYQAEFYRAALAEAGDDDLRGYVFGDPGDPARTFHFVELLRRHDVEVHRLGAAVAGHDPAGRFVVPIRQRQVRLVRTLFEKQLEFADSTFYDVSTWTAPAAFDLPVVALGRRDWRPEVPGAAVGEPVFPEGRFTAAEDAYTYAFRWSDYYAPRALHDLQRRGVRTRVATRPFSARTPEGDRDFERGAILVSLGPQELAREEVEAALAEVARRDGLAVETLSSGLTPSGIDLGSPSIEALATPVPALVVGEPAGTSAAGEIWHLLDRRFAMPLTLLEADRLGRTDLEKYTHLILVDGNYGSSPGEVAGEIDRWVRRGGVLIALQRAADWVGKEILAGPAPDGGEKPPASTESEVGVDAAKVGERRAYADFADDRAEGLISGAIFEVELDLTHPLAYGYPRETLPVFRNGKVFLDPPGDPYAAVAVYSESPLVSGYVSEENLERLRRSPAVIAERRGRGAVVRMADDPNFRAFWYGTHKLFLNALFFGGILDDTSAPH